MEQLIHRPSPREGAAFVTLDERVYLYGGMGLTLDGNLYELTMKDLMWKTVIGKNGLNGRFGHTIIPYRGVLVVFGGCERNMNRIKKYLNDTILINPVEPSIR
jgi:hypothetical protein